MRTYYGCKAIVKDGRLIGISEPQTFIQIGEMADGTKVYEDANKEQFTRTRVYGKYLFVHI